MLPLAPGRFSTSTCCPRRAASGSATTRALLSATPPGENGTMMRTGFAGHSCASAPVIAIAQRMQAIAIFIVLEDAGTLQLEPRPERAVLVLSRRAQDRHRVAFDLDSGCERRAHPRRVRCRLDLERDGVGRLVHGVRPVVSND